MLIPSVPTFADGMVAYYDPYSGRFDYSNETNQDAIISYENGLQKMILSIGIESTQNKNMVWIFPVPADPSKVVLDIFRDIPELWGEEMSGKAKMNLSGIQTAMLATQIYPLIFIGPSLGGRPVPYAMSPGYDYKTDETLRGGVEVYEHIEKEGVTSELVTAKTAAGLYDYLKDQGLRVEAGSIPVLDNYIGQDYSFVVSWLSDSSVYYSKDEITRKLEFYYQNPDRYPDLTRIIKRLEDDYPEFYRYSFNPMAYLNSPEGEPALNEIIESIENDPGLLPVDNMEYYGYGKDYFPPPQRAQRGVFVTFPTDEIYFPLIPTSVYGSTVVPATIYVIGHVTPRLYNPIKSYVTTNYYVAGTLSGPGGLLNLPLGYTRKYPSYGVYGNNGRYGTLKYTKIEINAPSKFFVDDLWMRRGLPPSRYLSLLVASHPVFLGIILLILSSIAAGIGAGMLALRGLGNNIKTLALIGLSNCLSIIGLIVAVIFLRTGANNGAPIEINEELKTKGYLKKRRLAAIQFLYSVPFLIFGLVFIPLTMNPYMNIPILAIIFLYILPIWAFIRALDNMKVKEEDRHLFTEMRQKNISTWGLQPIEGGKFSFVILFSIFFLIASWFLITLTELAI